MQVFFDFSDFSNFHPCGADALNSARSTSPRTSSPPTGSFDLIRSMCENKDKFNVIHQPKEKLVESFVQCCKFVKLANGDNGEFPEKTVRLLVKTAIDVAKGGFGCVAASNSAFEKLQKQKEIDFQVVDQDPRFPEGYLTQRLRPDGKPMHISDEKFAELICEFTDHSKQCNDRWRYQHEASGLPKDGYVLVGAHGSCRRGAVRITGLPTPPYRWDGVGTRHTTALATCWALRGECGVVVVRSDSGSVHCFCPTKDGIIAMTADCAHLVFDHSGDEKHPNL